MNSNWISVVAFAAGAAIGSVVTWKLVKAKYEQLAQEEIDSVKEVFAKRKLEHEKEKEINRDYFHIANKYHTESFVDNFKEGDTMPDAPHIISPDEYGDLDYDLVCLDYYADGILTDSAGDPIDEDDIEDFVCKDFADHFGEYEDDAVYVRNDRLMIDYEIDRDLRTYAEVSGEEVPHRFDE